LPGQLVSVDGLRIFVHRSGPRSRRPPVVLIHGVLVSHWEWKDLVPGIVGAGHEVIAFDLPGFGESDRPSPRDYRYDCDAFLSTIVGVLDALGVERAALVGHSLGGGLALYTAANRPERVDRLAVLDPLVYEPVMPLEVWPVLLPWVGPILFRTAFTRGLGKRAMKRDIYRDPSFATDERIDYVWERLYRAGGIEAAHAVMRMTRDPAPIRRAIRAVRAPIAIVWGEDDRIFPVAGARKLAADLPGAQVRIIPVCGHSPNEERPAETLRALLPFLASRESEIRRTA
jgi:pimeloyl-ACP methyl ester carboxylesterase